MTEEKYERIYKVLLNETELLANEGITTAEMAQGLSMFLVDLAFDCAPSTDHATLLIMGSVMTRLEQNIENAEDIKDKMEGLQKKFLDKGPPDWIK